MASEKTCVVCGYNLVGLSAAGNCPECGTPVAHSLRGNRLSYCSPEYLARLHRGVFLVLAAIIIQVIVFIASWLALAVLGPRGVTGTDVISQLIGLAMSAISLYGWWLFSELDPGYAARDTGATARRVVRVAVIVNSVASVLSAAAGFLLPSPGAIALNDPTWVLRAAAGLTSLLASIVQYFAAMRYLQWLAPRVPDQWVSNRARTLMWLGPVLMTVGALVFGLGIVVALVLYWNMLDRFRKDLKRIRAAQNIAPAPTV